MSRSERTGLQKSQGTMPLGKENLASITYKRVSSEGTVGLCLHCYHIAPCLAYANVYRKYTKILKIEKGKASFFPKIYSEEKAKQNL